jgi:hypothetical protein
MISNACIIATIAEKDDIQLPLIPFPKEVKSILKSLLLKEEIEGTKIEMPSTYCDLLSKAGLMERVGNKFVPTNFGKALGRVI